MEQAALDPRLRKMEQAAMKDKVVLLRVDHNVVKKGKIKDPYRIDATIGTLYAIAARGGRPILMTHVGRPKDKKTGVINCREGESVAAIVQYLEHKLQVSIHIPDLPVDREKGIVHLTGMDQAVQDLRAGKWDMLYLPNTRWFQGEESKGPEREVLAQEMKDLADLYVNDAFGSWQPHASTFDVAAKLPSYAGILLQKELSHLHLVLHPERPFVAVVAGAKYDTKIGPLRALYERVDRLILGGLMYNTFLAAKYDLRIAGVSDEDRALAAELVALDQKENKILELTHLVESDSLDERGTGTWRTLTLDDMRRKGETGLLLDVDPRSLDQDDVKAALGSARTIFINAVMGLMPLFPEGSEALFRLAAANDQAYKLLAGGDTLLEFRKLCPGPYMDGLDDPRTYYFTGGGSVLTAIEQGSAYGLKPVAALMKEVAS